MKRLLIAFLLVCILAIGFANASTNITAYPVIDGDSARNVANSTYLAISTGTGNVVTTTAGTFNAPYISKLSTTGSGLFQKNYRAELSFPPPNTTVPDFSNTTLVGGYLNLTAKTKTFSMGNFTIVVTSGSLTANNSIVAGDYQQAGTVELTNRVSSTDISDGSNVTLRFNAAGISYLSHANPIILTIRSGDDIDQYFNGVWPATGGANSGIVWYSNESGIGPSLTYSYVIGGTGNFTANFTANNTEGKRPLAVQFYDNTTSPTDYPDTWLWNFGDGNTSTVRNATHTYAAAGRYPVSLNASSSLGYSIATKLDFITVHDLGKPGIVMFTADDAAESILINASPILASHGWNGTFFVITGNVVPVGGSDHISWTELQAMYASGWSISSHTQTHPYLNTLTLEQQEAEFTNATADLVAHGIIDSSRYVAYPFGVTDSNTSIAMAATGMQVGRSSSAVVQTLPPSNWYALSGIRPCVASTDLYAEEAWFDSLNSNDVLIYTMHGVYTDTSDARCQAPFLENLTAYIAASGVPVITMEEFYTTYHTAADFTPNVSTGYQYPLPVTFTDASTGARPDNWSWNFGDTYTSTSRNTSHIYTVAGNYTVNLTVYNSTAGFSSVTKSIQLWADVDTYVRSWLQFENTTIIDLRGVAWTNSGGILSAPGRFGNQSLLLSGNNYISSASSPVWDRSPFAGEIEAWFNVSSYGDAGKPFFRRSSGTSGTSNGWGMFNINGTTCGNAFYYGSGSNYTTPFCMPLNTQTQVVLVRGYDQYWRVYVNGILWGTPVYMGALDVDTPNAFTIGSSGPGTEPAFRVDEFRFTQAVPRFISDFPTPYAAYRGSLTGGIDPNPNSTFRYKTNPADYENAKIFNQSYSGMRNRTVQMQNVTNARYAIGSVTFDAAHESGVAVRVNTSTYSDMVLESSSIDNTAGIASFNVSRGGSLNMSAPFDTRVSIVDIQLLYHTYSPDVIGDQFFASGTLIDGGSYPVHNFIATNMTYGMWGLPGVDFSANTTTPNILATVQFTDASTNYPDTYLWDFGDGTTSTLKNPTHVYTTIGTYDVTETAYLAANVSITGTTTKTAYITVLSSAGVPAANFVGTPLVTNIGSPVSFTDTSTGSPTSWTWDFGDSSGSATQNPTHAYSALGLYTVNLTVSNLNGTTTLSRASYINVTNATMTGFNPVDILMDPSYVLTLHVTNSNTGAAIPDVIVLDSYGNTYNTTTGTFALSYGYGAVVLYLTSSGYVSKSVSYIIDSDQTQTVQMAEVIESSSSNLNLLYPQQVQFALVDNVYGHALGGVEVTATMVNSTVDNTNWLSTLFGISSQATSINETALYGISDDSGSVSFPMISSGRYTMQFESTSLGISESRTVYPQQQNYIYILHPSAYVVPNMADYINGTLFQFVPNTSYVNLSFSYSDISHTTQSVVFYINAANRTRIYTKTYSNAILVNDSKMIANKKAAGYVWGYYANSTKFGNVSAEQGITMKGSSGKMINLDPCGGYATGWGNEC